MIYRPGVCSCSIETQAFIDWNPAQIISMEKCEYHTSMTNEEAFRDIQRLEAERKASIQELFEVNERDGVVFGVDEEGTEKVYVVNDNPEREAEMKEEIAEVFPEITIING